MAGAPDRGKVERHEPEGERGGQRRRVRDAQRDQPGGVAGLGHPDAAGHRHEPGEEADERVDEDQVGSIA
jgi:hypothetical protein